MKSTQWSLSKMDGLKSIIIAIGIPLLTVIQQLIPSWTPWLTEHLSSSGALIAQATLSGVVTAQKTLSRAGAPLKPSAPNDQELNAN